MKKQIIDDKAYVLVPEDVWEKLRVFFVERDNARD